MNDQQKRWRENTGRRLSVVWLVLVASVPPMGIGCRTAPRPQPRASAAGQTMVRTELFFGLSRPDGAADVTEAEFQAFLEQHVTPRFPDGYTVVPAEGRWRSGATTHREPSRILIILSPIDDATAGKIEAIRDAYKQQFQQEAVLRVDQEQTVSF